ncbi:hypothetical protein SAMN02927900_06018 [Rhizobium mongolense subsp. loessense]|uniref:Uncharacterized protein n=1 Tax=Rhizobium mongolense subsp. loessense TaxID=158890 RepID=A0A1G4U2D5_9HYPH|nr:hypothetical protein [Rhizobium mongolense]SCW87833.1 hypothetical protein SAMN02927900_06018 [Rhizobium mongolense subsp. loessense]
MASGDMISHSMPVGQRCIRRKTFWRREPRVAPCGRKFVFDAEFKDGDPDDPLAVCPKRIDQSDPAVVAKSSADEKKYQELAAKDFAPLAYQDGGLHPSFRTLLKENGDIKLAEKVSVIKYPISRPPSVLADPSNRNE